MTQAALTRCRIGTRSSPLALVQAGLVRDVLKAALPELEEKGAIEIVPIKASGDYDPHKGGEARLVDIGGKGLFTRELEEALLQGTIDVAVHSLKDVPTWLPTGLTIAAVLPRADVRDALIARSAKSLTDFPAASVIGTSSLRRQAQILNLRPDLTVVPLRGNVETRIKKMESGQVDATLLAYAGLQRLGLQEKASAVFEENMILPAVSQGIIGLEIREADAAFCALLQGLNHKETHAAMLAERAMLEVLDGNCRTPVAGLAQIRNNRIFLRGLVAHPEGKGVWRSEEEGEMSDVVLLGREVGRMLRRQVPSGILPE